MIKKSSNFAIISDTHDNLPNIEKALEIIGGLGITKIIHCGDVASPDTIFAMKKLFKGQIYISMGNMDEEHFEPEEISMNGLRIFRAFGEMDLGGKKIALTHKPEQARQLAYSKKYDFVFYGHTHKPWEEKVEQTRLVNPGNLAGLIFRPSFAVYDSKTDKLELKILGLS